MTKKYMIDCPRCEGAKRIEIPQDAWQIVEHGRRYEICPVCQGAGWITKTDDPDVIDMRRRSR